MYTVTFYSCRGGVGRTTALVNVAVDLALRRRKVLVVDFDLEAPSVPGFAPLQPDVSRPGLVEFITEYLHSGQAPDIGGYIYQAEPVGKNCGEIWVMPAGNINDESSGGEDYWRAFHEINWKELYELRDGFLLFEDLKFQWRESFQPDYVLIDARAGINDRLAICTRQLPDAVVMQFVPDRADLQGTKTFARDFDGFHEVLFDMLVRSPESDGRRIDVLPVASKVPDLDGEQLWLTQMILPDVIEEDYPLAATIPHAPELLLERQVNSSPRPRKRLACAYRRLANAIIRSNCTRDPEGARAFLKELQLQPNLAVAVPASWAGWSEWLSQRDEGTNDILDRAAQLDEVSNHFHNDPEILAQAASCLFLAGRYAPAMDLLDQAIELAPFSDSIRWQRASYRRRLKDPRAVADLLCLLEAPATQPSARSEETQLNQMVILPEMEQEAKSPELDTTPIDTADPLTGDFPGINRYVASAFQQLRRLNRDKLKEAEEKPRIQQLSPEDRDALIEDTPTPPSAKTDPRRLIRLKKWRLAIALLEPRVTKPSAANVADLCCLAMAYWGDGNEAQATRYCCDAVTSFLQERHLDLAVQELGDSAKLQDLPLWSLTFWKAGDAATAKRILDRCEERLAEAVQEDHFFSFWRFRPVDRSQFQGDCHEQRQMIQGAAIPPPFLGKKPGGA